MVELSSRWLEQLEEYMDPLRDAFRRRDQARWATVYLQGLLRPGASKTIGAMARHASLAGDLLGADVVQALQNFVNQSPWDDGKLWCRHRQTHPLRAAGPEGTWVVQDLAFLKQGRHSVGVQRQYSGVLGRKASCQVAIALFHASRAGVVPLGLQLYLPRSWTQDPDRLRTTAVPEEYCQPFTRGEIALRLIEQASLDGWSGSLVLAGPGQAADPTFREELSRRGLPYAIDTGVRGHAAQREARSLLLDGRLWLINLDEAECEAAEERIRQTGEQIEQANHILYDELGLDTFEGRSWRGFHHHACLVMLAYSFFQLTADCAALSLGR
jgi:SRSO17 transposase